MQQMTLFEEPRLREALYQAYFDARKNKRATINALDFELDFEHNLEKLYKDILLGMYEISPSICFIVEKPVKREVFAATFRDRIVHHYVINQLLQVFENQFIHDTYSCVPGKGNLFGIKRLRHFIRSCSDNYRRDAHILKLDIQGFFMSIDKQLLFKKLYKLIDRKYDGWDKRILIMLTEQIVMNDPTSNCVVKGSTKDWTRLPPSKSLFTAAKSFGMPIGNLTSQFFANFYLSKFDRFMKESLKLRYYGRYVDDFFVVHEDKKYLKDIVPLIKDFLKEKLHLTLHPKKVYLQSCCKGVLFIGAYLMPYRMYPSRRVVNHFVQTVQDISKNDYSFQKAMSKDSMKLVEARLNSYLGICQHYRAIHLCERTIEMLPIDCVSRFEVDTSYKKVKWSE